MNSSPVEKLIMCVAFLVAAICFLIQLAQGSSILYAAFVACCVVLATAIILRYAVKFLGTVMAQYLLTLTQQNKPSLDSSGKKKADDTA